MQRLLCALVLLPLGCGNASPPPAASPPPPSAPAPTPAAVAQGDDATPVPEPAGPVSCGPLDCTAYPSVEQAFAAVLETKPVVLAVGETHAQRGTEHLHSATRRFTEQLLPPLAGQATDLVLELWVASGGCGKQEKQVREQQKDVTETQASTNQNEFVVLGNTAKQLGIQPHVLRPSCEEYERIAKAGSGDIATMLEMIARLSREKIEQLVTKNRQANTEDKLVIAYGGAMHNDVEPREGREAWSFGPELVDATDGRYVELDLIVPEYVKDTDAWKSLPWYPHYDPAAHPDRVLLYRPNPGSFVMIFPRSGSKPAEAPARPKPSSPAGTPPNAAPEG